MFPLAPQVRFGIVLFCLVGAEKARHVLCGGRRLKHRGGLGTLLSD
jgi:hypothetical protein